MGDEVYVAVTNIPFNFHAADLRAHFSAFVESKSFICFHFRHRPEKSERLPQNEIDLDLDLASPISHPENENGKEIVSNLEQGSTSSRPSRHNAEGSKEKRRGTKCCVIKVLKSNLLEFINKYNCQQWTDVDGQYLSSLCQVTQIILRRHCLDNTKELTGEVEEADLLSMPELRPPEMMPNGNVGTPTLVFLDLIQKCLLPNNIIKKLHLQFPSTSARRIYSNVNFEYDDHQNPRFPLDFSSFSKDKVNPKLKSNTERSSGLLSDVKSSVTVNDFDPSKSNMINSKILEQSADRSEQPTGNLLEKNGASIKFHQKAGIESSLKSTFISPSSDFLSKVDRNNRMQTLTETIKTPDHQKCCVPNRGSPTGKERKRLEKEERRKTRALMNEGIEERLIQIEHRYHNDNDAEEWDRHEASEDDPSNQERNKERLYEEEIEQPWEKGGPGVVFYTDAMYWQAKEGDFDEQTTDDLDVDFSPYEGNGPGDKDIQDFLKIQQERRFRTSYDKTDRYSIGISKKEEPDKSGASVFVQSKPLIVGQFESHTRGIGRKLMEKQGWQDGQGLGVSGRGIKEALRGEGQKPKNKKGLGYVENEPNQYGPSVLKRAKLQKMLCTHLITTINDDPSLTDPKEPLLQRNEPSHLKHRQSFLDEHASKSSST